MSNDFYRAVATFKQQQGFALPDTAKAWQFIDHLFELLFTHKDETDNNAFEIEVQLRKLEKQLQSIIYTLMYSDEESSKHAQVFFQAIPAIYQKLLLDAKAIYEADPAAQNLNEVLIAYPGFYAIAVHRFAHQLHKQSIRLLPRLLSEYAHGKTGIDIHPGATIGNAFVIDHGTGIVIGETTIIGNNVKVFQSVTLGALSVSKDKSAEKRHPTIQDNVVIYSGATILGGQTVVGHDSMIGGNVWLTESVQPFSIVLHSAEVTIQDKKSFVEPYNYFI